MSMRYDESFVLFFQTILFVFTMKMLVIYNENTKATSIFHAIKEGPLSHKPLSE